jgi:hypothetical protein
LALACGIALARAAEPAATSPVAVVDNDGAILVWDGVSTELRPLPASLTSGVDGLRRVVAMSGGRALLLEPAAAATGKGGKEKARRTHEGEAVVLEMQGGAAKRTTAVVFEGLPVAGAVDGGRAWVVTWRGDVGVPGGKGWLHAIDLGEGRVVESSLLSARPLDVALDANSSRLYIAYPERIQTYGTAPLRVSWQYRSPGKNGPLTLLGGGIVAAVRSSEVALFEAARIDARGADERQHLRDDATAVVPLPFPAQRLSTSKDGTLALATGIAGLAFIDAAGAARAPEAPPHNLDAAVAAVPLDFPGSGRDLIVALFPGGAVSAVRSPEATRLLKVENVTPDDRFETGKAVRVPEGGAADKTAALRVAEKQAPAPPSSSADSPPPAAPASASSEPAPAAEEHPVLSGRLAGAHQKARAVVFYGPNNILKEYGRAPVDPQGNWTMPLPPPGSYRVIPVGDGSDPLPVVPGFRTIKVAEGSGQQNIDFELR